MEDNHYYTKYLKYKSKYLNLIKQTGGDDKIPINYTIETLIKRYNYFYNHQ